MFRNIVFALVAALCFAVIFPAQAKCMANDRWRGQDKALHFTGGAAIAGLVTAHTKNAMTGFLAGVAVAGLKEIADAGGTGTCSLQDFGVTVLGAGLAAGTGHLILRKQGDTVQVVYKLKANLL